MRRALSGVIAVVVSGSGVAGCGPPAELRVEPVHFQHTARLGDAPTPLTASTIELRSTVDDESVGWSLSGAPAWLQASATRGGTPADVELRFDLAAMTYGENEASLVFRHRETDVPCAVQYDLLGALTIGPVQSVSLRGVVGQEHSSAVELALGSPVKPGLRWRARTDDPWIVVKPSEGETPATVSVFATIAKAASNSSGRIEFAAECAWLGSPTVIPVVIEILNPEAIRKQIDAKLALIRTERDDSVRQMKKSAEALPTLRGVEPVVAAFREIADRAASGATRISTLEQDLLGFLEQNAAYEALLAFPDARAEAARVAAEGAADATRFRKCVEGIRTVSLDVDSRAEWQRSELEVRPGDLVSFEATGSWKLGFMIADAGPEGLSTPSIEDSRMTGRDYAGYSVEASRNHGCLLLRVGDAVIAGQAKHGLARASQSGFIEGRCNDKKYTDNRGKVVVRLAVIPAP